MHDKLNESLDSEFLERENPKNERVFVTVNWIAIGSILIGALFNILHLSFSAGLLLCSGILVSFGGSFRFYYSPYTTPAVIVQLIVNLLVVLWVFSTVYYISFKTELKYITFGVILIKYFFFRNLQSET